MNVADWIIGTACGDLKVNAVIAGSDHQFEPPGDIFEKLDRIQPGNLDFPGSFIGSHVDPCWVMTFDAAEHEGLSHLSGFENWVALLIQFYLLLPRLVYEGTRRLVHIHQRQFGGPIS